MTPRGKKTQSSWRLQCQGTIMELSTFKRISISTIHSVNTTTIHFAQNSPAIIFCLVLA
ncbi:hypothetical protein RSOL_047460 [Rhizoctonia solani AG-3 Rhs1AP]|uniref:Uncharacterized protein n=1 Tax=Rhizoctonia solani AG-3 Rhs1AP TaxID=1086054 RepID=X8IXD3_9AGAM|nr:hypothetical protein RSOL_047460 [Rhizoctonia solani AG-3 Rhs1AP]